tara:strand:- start:375 stop:608 length:234 start_codon:yes stop_codon:yes gene_type:complete
MATLLYGTSAMSRFNPTKKEQEEQKKKILYHSARHCWNIRNQPCPRGGNWGEWFKRTYGLSLDDYAQQKRREALGLQ